MEIPRKRGQLTDDLIHIRKAPKNDRSSDKKITAASDIQQLKKPVANMKLPTRAGKNATLDNCPLTFPPTLRSTEFEANIQASSTTRKSGGTTRIHLFRVTDLPKTK